MLVCSVAGVPSASPDPYPAPAPDRTPRRIRVYTRTGDKGKSSLFNGTRSGKNDLVFHALGDTDEVNANLGVAMEHCRLVGERLDADSSCGVTRLITRLGVIQSRLLDAGSAIATPVDR